MRDCLGGSGVAGSNVHDDKKKANPLKNFVVLGVVGSLYCYIPSLSILLRSYLPCSLLSVPTTLAGILRARS